MPSWPITTYDLHGRYNNDYCVFLFQFAGIIAMIFIVEVIGAVLAFIFSDQIKNKVTDVLKDEAIVRYREDANLHDLINWFQENVSIRVLARI